MHSTHDSVTLDIGTIDRPRKIIVEPLATARPDDWCVCVAIDSGRFQPSRANLRPGEVLQLARAILDAAGLTSAALDEPAPKPDRELRDPWIRIPGVPTGRKRTAP